MIDYKKPHKHQNEWTLYRNGVLEGTFRTKSEMRNYLTKRYEELNANATEEERIRGFSSQFSIKKNGEIPKVHRRHKINLEDL